MSREWVRAEVVVEGVLGLGLWWWDLEGVCVSSEVVGHG
jgi:hypothetical protein